MFRHALALVFVAVSLPFLVPACASADTTKTKTAIGGSCSTNADCLDGAFCQQGTYAPILANICTAKCATDHDCAALGSDLFCHKSYGLCAANCDKGQTCPKGGVCFEQEYCANSSH